MLQSAVCSRAALFDSSDFSIQVDHDRQGFDDHDLHCKMMFPGRLPSHRYIGRQERATTNQSEAGWLCVVCLQSIDDTALNQIRGAYRQNAAIKKLKVLRRHDGVNTSRRSHCYRHYELHHVRMAII